MPQYALEVIGGQHVGARFPLEGESVTIGRHPDNLVRLEDWGISRHHARLSAENGSWVLEDLGSRNGVRVGAENVSKKELQPGDEIAIGQAKLRFLSEVMEETENEEPMGETGVIPDKELELEVTSGEAAKATEDAARPETPRAPAATDSAPAAEGPRSSSVRRKPSAAPPLPKDEAEAVAHLREARQKIMGEMSKVVIGQHAVIEQLLVALFSRGHCLMVGVPGLAKTLMVRTLGQVLELDSKRIQFTPDLMPSDITGTQILEEDAQSHQRTFRFMRGPVFTNILLADEINRTPPKTQAALLEAMQEGRVTAAGTSYPLTKPFFVLATQNPIEQEGTYPLPEAQLDRFMFMVKIGYPSRDEEMEIYRATTGDAEAVVRPILSGEAILRLQRLVRRVPVSDHVTAYAADLVRATRPDSETAPDFVKAWLSWGAGPRAGQYLLLAAKAHAILGGRMNVSCEDVRHAALPVLRHRIFCNFNASSEGVDSDQMVERILKHVPEPSEKDYQ